ncbi:ribonuclease HI [Bacteroidia bacterium]|nr:ribonuclease HI [Bacteroidia bacterium]
MKINLYTDGACSGNPGKGGYGAVLLFGEKRKEMAEAYELTTNNRMELLAVIKGLEQLKHNKYPIECFTDSKYVCDSINKGWLMSWQAKGFKKKKNVDLWKRMIPLLSKFNPKFTWVKGHAGNALNERCDELAVEAYQKGPWQTDHGYENELD